MKAHHLMLLFVAAVFLFCVGCAQENVYFTQNPNFDEVWLGTLDAVSDYLHVENANTETGVIIARSDTRWLRSEAKVDVIKDRGVYSVVTKARDEKLRVLLKPSGLRTGEETDLLGQNKGLERKLIKNIKRRVPKKRKHKSPKEDPLAGVVDGLVDFVTPPVPESGFVMKVIQGVPYERVFDETEIAISNHFDILSSDRASGIITTRYSAEKSIDGIIKMRTIAFLKKGEGDKATAVYLKIVRERFWEKWEFDHNLTTQVDLVGYDKRLANVILDDVAARTAR
ncbi:MAG: hypothetical protein GXP25_01430 [Planctomycetes bacterium]|nr:hypothetical protein [Planctomycetota bacterium]